MAAILCCGFLAACGGGGGESAASTGYSDPVQNQNSSAASDADVIGALSKSMSVVNQVAPEQSKEHENRRTSRDSDALGTNDGISNNIELVCEEGGSADFSGTGSISAQPGVLTLALEFQIDFADCSGYSGSLRASGGAVAQAGIINQDLTLNGTLVDASCSYTFTRLTEQAVIDSNAVTHSAVISGLAEAACGLVTTLCSWDNVSLSDLTALEHGCRQTVVP